MGPKDYVVITSELRYKNQVKITLGSFVRLTLANYVIKHCKWDQKNNIVITFGSNARITSQELPQTYTWKFC